MDYQSEFARIKEERRRLKELERTLRAEQGRGEAGSRREAPLRQAFACP